MKINFAPRGILQIDDARIIFRNFRGEGGKFNREGDRNFAVVIPDRVLTTEEVESILGMYSDAELVKNEEGVDVLMIDDEPIITLVDALKALRWNVKIKAPREDGDSPFMYLPVKIRCNERGPIMILKSGNNVIKLDEESMSMLDEIDILSVDMDLRPFDWEVNGGTGRTAYLQSIHVTQEIDRFMARYAGEEFPEE